MNHFLRNSRVPAIVLATILAGGTLVAWGITSGIVGAVFIESWYKNQLQEALRITYQGRAVIAVRKPADRTANPIYLSLDRQMIPNADLGPPRTRVQQGSDSPNFIS